jgi:hypothetical protein
MNNKRKMKKKKKKKRNGSAGLQSSTKQRQAGLSTRRPGYCSEEGH